MFSEILSDNKIIPVVTVTNEQQAIDLTLALKKGGISVVEITLRTSAAIVAIKAIKEHVPDVIVLAGTVVNTEDMELACNAGADGAVSPAFSSALVGAAKSLDLPLLPGVATPSEVLAGMEAGLTEFKLFPAAAIGGIPLLKSIHAPMPTAQFCPTGGLTMDNFTDYLSLPNVMCVGGSWMVPEKLVATSDWKNITQLAAHSTAKITTD
jgi:2-dehydro-3-deoxyphosphogluconate aldolase/(4S)-4-hydroxy-2-oxoglutarate aldolase